MADGADEGGRQNTRSGTCVHNQEPSVRERDLGQHCWSLRSAMQDYVSVQHRMEQRSSFVSTFE